MNNEPELRSWKMVETSNLYHYVKASGLVDEDALDRVLEGVVSGDPAFLEIDPFLTDLSAMPIDRHHLRRPIRLQRGQRRTTAAFLGTAEEDSRSEPGAVSDTISEASLDGESIPKEMGGVTDIDGRLAEELIRRGFLNRWQTKQFLSGRTKFTLGNYRILDALGRGGYGHVFLGQEEKADRPRYVALKVLPLAKATPELTRRFLHEIEIQKNLSHSNLVRFLGSGRDGNVHYMVHEFIDGGDLRELFHREGVLSIDVVAPFLSQIARGIHYLHENGIVHRDIKPANVLLVSTGEAKLTDLGLSLPFGQAVLTGTATDTVISTVAGTVDYMAPDQILDPAHPAPAWDVYSLGCTLYQLLTGTVPFSRSDAQQKLRARVQADAKDARIHHQAIPFDVADLLRSMLARNPVERPTASEVARRLNAWCPKGNSALTPFSLRHGFKG